MTKIQEKQDKTANQPTRGEQSFFVVLALIFVFNIVCPGIAFASPTSNTTSMVERLTTTQRNQTLKNAVGSEYRVKRVTKVVATAYSSTPDQTDDTPLVAASGKYVYDGLIAANFLRFGTKVRFPDIYGDKVFTVDDRMHPRFNNRIDVWMTTREEALQFGIKTIRVEILEKRETELARAK